MTNEEKLRYISERRTSFRETLRGQLFAEFDLVYQEVGLDNENQFFELFEPIVNWNIVPFLRECITDYLSEIEEV